MTEKHPKHVSVGPGGDYEDIASALAAAKKDRVSKKSPRVITVAAGEYDEALDVPKGVTLRFDGIAS
jgi:pectin methylesterase-like acyl-CoA thioesterase